MDEVLGGIDGVGHCLDRARVALDQLRVVAADHRKRAQIAVHGDQRGEPVRPLVAVTDPIKTVGPSQDGFAYLPLLVSAPARQLAEPDEQKEQDAQYRDEDHGKDPRDRRGRLAVSGDQDRRH